VKIISLATFYCGNCKLFKTTECGHVNSATGKSLKQTDVACMLDFEIVDEPLTEEELKEN
jgi:hypothetical protein